jgi:DNA mismatch endonuclease (patch repair protein)
MADVFSKSKRSEIMSAIRGKGNRTTEWQLRSRLISSGINGWHVNSPGLIGSPDFAFERARLVVFVDGCFWHGCKRCRTIPSTNRAFWLKKIRSNRRRDSSVTNSLRNDGWSVLRFWEHDVKRDPNGCICTISSLLTSRPVKLRAQFPRNRRRPPS